MKTHIYLSSILFWSVFLFANIVKCQPVVKDSSRLILQDIRIYGDSFHIRISTEIQSIDIGTKDFIFFYGTVTNHTFATELKSNQFYSQTVKLDSEVAKKVYNLSELSNILMLPTQDSIAGWSNGLDGSTYVVEFIALQKYHYKQYWSPDAYPSIKEALKIDNALTKIFATVNLASHWSKFLNSLPIGCYKDMGNYITCMKKKKRIKH